MPLPGVTSEMESNLTRILKIKWILLKTLKVPGNSILGGVQLLKDLFLQRECEQTNWINVGCGKRKKKYRLKYHCYCCHFRKKGIFILGTRINWRS